MKRLTYGTLIGLSWDRMKLILFSPLSLKKWIMLGIIVLFAGQFGAFNLNLNLPNPKGTGVQKGAIVQSQEASAPQQQMTKEGFKKQVLDPLRISVKALLKDRLFITLAVFAAAAMIIVSLLWGCIMAVFSFIFIESVVKDDASISAPFHKNTLLGVSYFLWNLIFGIVAMVVILTPIGLLIRALFINNIFSNPAAVNFKMVFSLVIPYIAVFIIAAVILGVIGTFAADFVSVIMYARKVKVRKAWGIFLGIASKNKWELIRYIFVKIGLSILSIIVGLILLIIGLILMLLILGVSALAGFVIYKLTPLAAKPIVTIILVVIGVSGFAVVVFLLRFIFLPIPVFFRLFSMYFLESIDSTTNLLMPVPEEILKEDMTQYRKPMVLFWSAILLTIAVVVLIISSVIVGRKVLAQTIFPETETTAVGSAASTMPAPSVAVIPAVKKNIVKVYLKNGRTFQAEIATETAQDVTFKVSESTFMFHKSDIKSIERRK